MCSSDLFIGTSLCLMLVLERIGSIVFVKRLPKDPMILSLLVALTLVLLIPLTCTACIAYFCQELELLMRHYVGFFKRIEGNETATQFLLRFY